MTPRDHAARAADALLLAVAAYYDAQRVLSPDTALRATAAEVVRCVATVAADEPRDDLARALAVAFAGACKGLPVDALVARLRATADWLDRTATRKEAALWPPVFDSPQQTARSTHALSSVGVAAWSALPTTCGKHRCASPAVAPSAFLSQSPDTSPCCQRTARRATVTRSLCRSPV